MRRLRALEIGDDGRLTPAIASGVRSVVLLDEDARALNGLRGVDARPFTKRDNAVGLGLVFQVLHVCLALDELRCLGWGQLTRPYTVGDALRLRVLARIDPRRAGEAGCRGDGKNSAKREIRSSWQVSLCLFADGGDTIVVARSALHTA